MSHKTLSFCFKNVISNKNINFAGIDASGNKRYIEVKGRAGTDGVMLSENEMNRLAQLGCRAWLYIVTECRGNSPQLNRINNSASTLVFEKKTKGIQFYLPLEEWKAKCHTQPNIHE